MGWQQSWRHWGDAAVLREREKDWNRWGRAEEGEGREPRVMLRFAAWCVVCAWNEPGDNAMGWKRAFRWWETDKVVLTNFRMLVRRVQGHKEIRFDPEDEDFGGLAKIVSLRVPRRGEGCGELEIYKWKMENGW